MFVLYNAADYYFSEDSEGRRRYYDRYTGKRIRERHIPEDIIDDIPDESVDIENDVDVLLRMKTAYEEQIEILKQELKEIEEKLDLPSPKDKRTREKKRPSFPVDLFETLVRIYGETLFANINFFQESFTPQTKRSTFPGKREGTSILLRLGINNRKEWLHWLRANHPDKGGDTEVCKSVIIEGKKRGW